jgi:L-fuconolactonase
MNIDAHFHAWQIARGDYGWLTPALAPIYRDVEVADWWQQAKGRGIGGGVLVQAAPTAAETAFLLQLADQHPQQVLGVVGWVDLQAADAAEQVRALAAHPRLKGLRPMLQDLAQTDWILQERVQAGLAAMADYGLVFDALIEPRHLPVIAELAQRHPTLPLVIDHGAKPRMQAPTAGPAMQQWQGGLQTLAQQTRSAPLMCKLSGLWTEAPAGEPCEHVRPWAQSLLEIWGAERLIWGSDWPVLELAGSYAQWRDWSVNLLAPLSPQQREAVLGGNAQRLYRLRAAD